MIFLLSSMARLSIGSRRTHVDFDTLMFEPVANWRERALTVRRRGRLRSAWWQIE